MVSDSKLIERNDVDGVVITKLFSESGNDGFLANADQLWWSVNCNFSRHQCWICASVISLFSNICVLIHMHVTSYE